MNSAPAGLQLPSLSAPSSSQRTEHCGRELERKPSKSSGGRVAYSPQGTRGALAAFGRSIFRHSYYRDSSSHPSTNSALIFAAVDTATQLERVLGPGWEAYTRGQVEERARELEGATNFAWAVVDSMRVRHAETVGGVLHVAHPNG